MAIELITGKAGTPHIDSADIGAFQAYTIGEGVYVLNGCEAAIASANSVTVAAGDVLAEGRHFRITGAGETLPIGNGQSGYRRNDIIAAKYTRDGDGIERVELVVVPGTPATANQVDPSMPNTGSVLDGSTIAYWPMYRVVVDGLTPQAPVMVAEDIPGGFVTLYDAQANPGSSYAKGSSSITKQLADSLFNYANIYICMRPWKYTSGGTASYGERYTFATTGADVKAQIETAEPTTWGKTRRIYITDGSNGIMSDVTFNADATAITWNAVTKLGANWDSVCLVGIYGFGRID